MPASAARRADLEGLHPVVRAAVVGVLEDVRAANLPFRLFESYRSPERQAMLFAQGRTAPGDIVTKARPWTSYHQYGLAADFVLFIDGKWSWSANGVLARAWDQLHEIGRKHGLEPLSWERPHLQLIGTTIERLRAGDYPPGGDSDWAETLQAAIAQWPGPGAPPAPKVPSDRPPLEDTGPEPEAEPEEIFALSSAPTSSALREQPERGLTAAIIQAAQASQLLWGVPTCVTLAQFILESGNGKSMPPLSNNPFGIKAREGEPYVLALTKEVVNGREIRIQARFRKFNSFDEAFSHHARLLATSRYYAKAMALRHDPVAFAHALTGVYATDPRYGAKLVELIDRCDLRSYDVEVPVVPMDPRSGVAITGVAMVPAPLGLGDSGANVKALQQALKDAGYSLGAVDGVFGTLTRSALLGFQADNGLAPTGTADAATVQQLNLAPQRPISYERMAATEKDLVAKGSVTMTEARRTRLLGLITTTLGGLGIGNSAIVAGADSAAAPAQPQAVEAVLGQITSVLADPQAVQNTERLQSLLETARTALRGLQSGASPDLVRLATELRQALPADVLARNPEMERILSLFTAIAPVVKGDPRTMFDMLPTMFADGSVLQLVAQGAAAVAASTIPGLGGSVAALGIGLLARYFGDKIAKERLKDHHEARNIGR